MSVPFPRNDVPPLPDGRTLPVPAGPYSQTRVVGGTLAVSGQVGIDPVNGELADGITAQTEQTLRNLRNALWMNGADLPDVLRVGVYLSDIRTIAVVNEIYGRTLSTPYPARTTVQVGLPPGILIEIDALAMLPRSALSASGG
ncbi:RidA family protein [Streptomyces mirabilis]|uniref:RidA family protein n=1 Tax=Streptomyces mirabilis TaxID=68239 RepID=UPI00381F5D76